MLSLGGHPVVALVRVTVFQRDGLSLDFCCGQLTKNVSKGVLAKNLATQISRDSFLKCTWVKLPLFRTITAGTLVYISKKLIDYYHFEVVFLYYSSEFALRWV